MIKWEYCVIFQRKAGETWLCHPSGEKQKVKGNPGALMRTLQSLGAEGWEAVTYTPGEWPKAGRIRYSLGDWLGDDNFNREIFLKRPVQE